MQYNTTPKNKQEKIIIEKIRTLSPEKVTQLVDFADFLSQKDSDRQLTGAVNKLAEPAFNRVWDNPEDAVYDNL